MVLHSLRLPRKLPEGLCKWNQVFQKASWELPCLGEATWCIAFIGFTFRQAVDLDPWMLFREDEGLTLILGQERGNAKRCVLLVYQEEPTRSPS